MARASGKSQPRRQCSPPLSAAVYAQDKFDKDALKSPRGIEFAAFRGYEDWAVLDVISTSEDQS